MSRRRRSAGRAGRAGLLAAGVLAVGIWAVGMRAVSLIAVSLIATDASLHDPLQVHGGTPPPTGEERRKARKSRTSPLLRRYFAEFNVLEDLWAVRGGAGRRGPRKCRWFPRAARQTGGRGGRGGLPPRRAVRRGSIVEGGMNQGTSPRTSIIQLLR